MKYGLYLWIASAALGLTAGCGNARTEERRAGEGASVRRSEEPPEERGEGPEGPPPARELDRVVLLDVQGLWGGRDLWIAAGGEAVCRFVRPPDGGRSGLRETRHRFELSAAQRKALAEGVREHDFFSMKTKDRYGVPDESRPCIHIESGGRTHAVGKWQNDGHEGFDALYGLLKEIAESGKRGERVHEGPLDWDWRPDGFPERKRLLEETRPKPK